MMQPSDAELIRQINREGKRWGLCHMISSYGTVLVAEKVPCLIPIGNGTSVLEHCVRDVATMSTEYPFSSVLRNRLSSDKRKVALAVEISHLNEVKKHEAKLADIHHELKGDLKKSIKGVIRIGG